MVKLKFFWEFQWEVGSVGKTDSEQNEGLNMISGEGKKSHAT